MYSLKSVGIYAIALAAFVTNVSSAGISIKDKKAQCRGVAITAAATKDLESDFRRMDFSERDPKKDNLDWGIKLRGASVKKKYRSGWQNVYVVHFVSGEAPVHPSANVEYEVTTEWTRSGCVALSAKIVAEE